MGRMKNSLLITLGIVLMSFGSIAKEIPEKANRLVSDYGEVLSSSEAWVQTAIVQRHNRNSNSHRYHHKFKRRRPIWLQPATGWLLGNWWKREQQRHSPAHFGTRPKDSYSYWIRHWRRHYRRYIETHYWEWNQARLPGKRLLRGIWQRYIGDDLCIGWWVYRNS